MIEKDIKKLDKEKINKLLGYWINHNNINENEMEKWINKIKKYIYKESFKDLIEIIK